MAISEATWRRIMPQPMTEARRRLAVQQDRGGVLEPTSVATLHAQQRSFEPPKGYSLGIAKLRAERGQPATTPRPRAAGEVARPYTEGIAARHAAAGTPPPAVAPNQGHEPPRPWTLAIEREARS